MIRNPICQNSIGGYNSQNVHFVLYCWRRDKPLLTDTATATIESVLQEYTGRAQKKELRRAILNMLAGEGTSCPIKLELITGERFVAYLLGSKNAQGENLSNSTYGNKRAALHHLFRSFGQTQSQQLKNDLKEGLSGLKRTVAIEKQRGDGRVETGKEPMSFGLYKALCKWFLDVSGSDGVFGHLYLVLSWNLACRSVNTASIQLGHFRWAEDSFQIFFAHQKNDQTGERSSRHPRNIYPNALDPIICPVLSVGLYMMYFPNVLSSNGPLFPGTHQYKRFSKLMNRVLRDNIEIVRRLGHDIKHVGTHSIRKGGATYASSGSTAGPSAAAVSLRVGWTQGNVQDIYIKYEAAGDQYVGRLLCGLPVNSSDFATVGPRFVLDGAAHDENTARINVFVQSCFLSRPPENWLAILTNCVASLLFHFDWLLDRFPNTHRIRNCYLFKSNVADLRLIAKCGQPWTDDFHGVTATGIPPHPKWNK